VNADDIDRRERGIDRDRALLAALLPVVAAAIEKVSGECANADCAMPFCRAVRALIPEQRAEIERRAGK
jgi:hypothetical protein